MLLLLLLSFQIYGGVACSSTEFMIDDITYDYREICYDSLMKSLISIEDGKLISKSDSILEISTTYEKNTLSKVASVSGLTFRYIAAGIIVIPAILINFKEMAEFGTSLVDNNEFYNCLNLDEYHKVQSSQKKESVIESSVKYCDLELISDSVPITKDTLIINKHDYEHSAIIIDTIRNSETISSNWKPNHKYSVSAGVVGAIATTVIGYYVAYKLGYLESNSDGIAAPPVGLVLTPIITIPIGAVLGIILDESMR